MKRYGQPALVVTDQLRSYFAAMREIGNAEKQVTGRYLNNRIENSHLPFRRRERAMSRFRRVRSLQRFLSVHASVFNHFNQDRSFSKRKHFKLDQSTAITEWRGLGAALRTVRLAGLRPVRNRLTAYFRAISASWVISTGGDVPAERRADHHAVQYSRDSWLKA